MTQRFYHEKIPVSNFSGHNPNMSKTMPRLMTRMIPNIAYVTSLYSVREDYLSTLYQNFQQLIRHIQAPIFVFTDRELPFQLPLNVHVLRQNVEEFETYTTCMNMWREGLIQLPKNRNPTKDTAEFMALMNTKIEMVWRAIPWISETIQHIAWIDAGIMKIVKDIHRIQKAFQAHALFNWPQNMTVPGCWRPCIPSSDAICWRFCGGFFVIPTARVEEMHAAIKTVLSKWLAAGHLAWEVNIWAALEVENPDLFTWWKADHNETMLEAPAYTDIT